ncbi:MAG: SDR family NAD(P)-dependent oxidoreductase [Bacteroidetes bacterium]|nr:SDR family NAD(P)-dependent oxidoreductase [Bacteroidota bacterium]
MNSVFITGASSGIGEHLAYFYAQKKITLGLSARRREELTRVAKKCESLGAKVFFYQLDVKNSDDVKNAIQNFTTKIVTLDCVIANAGIGKDEKILIGNPEIINSVLETNILGVTNTLLPAIPIMKNQNFGKLVAISSVASFIPTPNNSGYSASKAAVKMLMDGFRLKLSQYDIECITICPGFIDTPIVTKNKPTPMMLDVESAVKKIARAINQNRKTFIFPWQYKIILPILKLIPDWVIKKLIA